MTVLTFAEVGRADVGAAGGKGAALGELLRAGIRVPDGFVVTTTAFRTAVSGLGLAERVTALDASGDLTAACAELRAVVESTPLPDEVAAAITAAYAALGDPDLPVAVRSSATSEDSAE